MVTKAKELERSKQPLSSRRPKNRAEAAFYDYAMAKGVLVTKQGWPDFACFLPSGRFIAVEVKPRRAARLKSWQAKVLCELARHGIDCYRWSPSSHFVKIKPNNEGEGVGGEGE